jgi:hypothetical protein
MHKGIQKKRHTCTGPAACLTLLALATSIKVSKKHIRRLLGRHSGLHVLLLLTLQPSFA